MRKRLLVLAIVGTGILFFTSCKKDKSESDFDTQFPADQNVAADKAKLEENTQLAVAELNSFADEKGLDAINSFAEYMSNADPLASSTKSAKNNMVFSTVYKLSAASATTNPRDIFGSINTVMTDSFQSIQEIWDKLKGIYTWNSTTKDWDYAASTSVAEFHFPSTKTGTSNNAVFAITSYKGIPSVLQLEGSPSDVPTEAKANLKVDGTEYFSFNFSASYNDKGIPSSIVTSVALRTFVFTFSFTNTSSDIAVNYKFTNGSKIIFDIGASVNGKFTQENIDAAQNVDQVLYSANAHFQLFNVKIAGMVDVVKLAQAQRTIYANEDDIDFDNIEADSLMATEINKNAKLIVFFTDTKQKIANIEAYSYADEYTYTTYVWDYDTNQFVLVTKRDSYVDLRLVFADGSPANADNYFGEGFSGLVTDINSLLADLNSKFGSNFEPINY